MKWTIDSDVQAGYYYLTEIKAGEAVEQVRVEDKDIILDFNKQGQLIGIEFLKLQHMPPQCDSSLTPTWTSEKPTEPGWYWYRGGEEKIACAVEVAHFDGVLCALAFDFYASVRELHGEWSDRPIEGPGEK